MESFKKLVIPCDITPSLSISPNAKPPSFALPLTGCLVNNVLGPFAL